MKVEIKHRDEENGMFNKVVHHAVLLSVKFNQEELAVLDHKHRADIVVLSRSAPATADGKDDLDWDLKVGHLVNGSKKDTAERHTFWTVGAARAYEESLVEALTNLKSFVVENSESLDGQVNTFEL